MIMFFKLIITVKGGHCDYLPRHCPEELSETNLAVVPIPTRVPISQSLSGFLFPC